MELATALQSLREIDVNDLSLENIGVWPLPIKIAVWLVLFSLNSVVLTTLRRTAVG